MKKFSINPEAAFCTEAQHEHNGFTLIELVMVIVVLSIIAAFALPRLFDFSQDTRVATVEGIGAAVQSAMSIAHSNCMVDPACDPNSSSSSTTLEGKVVSMSNGYPASSAAGIGAAVQIESDKVTIRFEPFSPWNWTVTYVFFIQEDCKVRYGAQMAVVEIITTGC